MRVTRVNLILNKNKESKELARGIIVLDDCLIIRNVKLVQGKQRLFVQFPDKKKRDRFIDVVHPATNNLRSEIEEIVINKYHQLRENADV